MRIKHIPIRTCVACRTTDSKRTLLRLVRLPEGVIQYDPKGKLAGRGAYLCARIECCQLAKKQKKLERSFKINPIPETLFEHLLDVIKKMEPIEAATADEKSTLELESPIADSMMK